MHILFVSTYYKPAYSYGGTVSADAGLCEALVRQGVNLCVLTTDSQGHGRLDVTPGEIYEVGRVPVRYFPLLTHTFYYAPGLGSAVKEHVPNSDLVIIQSLWGYPFLPTAKACKKAGVPYIVPLHGQLLPWSIRKKGFKKRVYLSLFGKSLLAGAAALHCTASEEMVNLTRLGVNTPAFTIPHGINLDQYKCLPDRGQYRNSLEVPEEARIILFLGRLHHKKNPGIAVICLAKVRECGFNVHLIFAGPDEEKLIPHLSEVARGLNCLDYVHFTGLLTHRDILPLLVETDLLLMPSEPYSENFGMSALEAMAAGVPILVSEGVPVGGIAQAEGAGRIVPCDAEIFANATVEMLSDPLQLQEMGARGREIARKNYDIDVVARQMIAQYEAIIHTGKPLPG